MTRSAIVTDHNGQDRYIVVSSDCHAGGDIADYRPYLESKWLEDFDAWADAFENPYEDLEGDLGPRNWDSSRRKKDLNADGVVAEVIFPNTVPPFYPKSSLTTQPPAMTSLDMERRWAGLRAHNRWLADFCRDTPGQRAGVVQINMLDLDATVAEITWARENGLTGGVLLPGTPPGGDAPQLYESYYEPLWRVCEDLAMPVNHHTGSASPPMGPTDVDAVVFMLEVSWFAHRAFTHLVIGGALERHPEMQVVFTEQGTAWVPEELARLDFFFDRMAHASGSQEAEWGRSVVGSLSLKPSEYWARQCQLGASFIRPNEVGLRGIVGLDSIMWGADYPHKEASSPYSELALRASFAPVPVEETALMIGGNAARLYGFDLDALAPLAAAHGPKVSDVHRPIAAGEIPLEAYKCPAFAPQNAA